MHVVIEKFRNMNMNAQEIIAFFYGEIENINEDMVPVRPENNNMYA